MTDIHLRATGATRARDPIHVLIVDNRCLVRTGLRTVLEAQPGIVVVGEASDGNEGVALAATFPSDVVLMDVRLLTQRMLDRVALSPAARSPEISRDPTAVLTPREREILLALGGGLSNSEIGEQFFLTQSTVKSHVSRVLAKLALRDRVQAVIFVYEHGLMQPA
jgi:DNA-binding NarL/FixJ family response regulator